MVTQRWFRFYAVGAAGMVVQAGVFAALTLVLGPHYLVATAVAVEVAVLHNFFWHRRWTWADRRDSRALGQLLRFHLTTGVASIGGNLLFMRLLVGGLHIHPLLAGLVTVAGCSAVNFVVSDQVVFTSPLRCGGWGRYAGR
jgi:putative flippase GtrA